MSNSPLANPTNRVLIEVAAMRLAVRALIANMIATDPAKADQVLTEWASTIEAMAPEAVSYEDLKPASHAAAIAAVRHRAACLAANL